MSSRYVIVGIDIVQPENSGGEQRKAYVSEFADLQNTPHNVSEVLDKRHFVGEQLKLFAVENEAHGLAAMIQPARICLSPWAVEIAAAYQLLSMRLLGATSDRYLASELMLVGKTLTGHTTWIRGIEFNPIDQRLTDSASAQFAGTV